MNNAGIITFHNTGKHMTRESTIKSGKRGRGAPGPDLFSL